MDAKASPSRFRKAEGAASAPAPTGALMSAEQFILARDLRAIVDLLPDVVFKCEKRADGKIYWLLNEGKLAHEFGVNTENIKGKTLEEMFPPNVVEQVLPEFEKCFEGEAREFIDQIGERYFKHFPQPVFDAAGKVTHVIGFISEVTNLKKAEAEVKALNEELRQRLAELETANKQLESYSYSVSHDLRGPLSTLKLTAQTLERKLKDHTPDVQPLVGRLLRTSERMTELIDDIMRVARATGGERTWEDVDLADIATATGAELALQHPDHRVRFSVHSPLPCRGDRRLLALVIENLVGNAWKYTQRVKRPHIEVGRVHVDGRLAFYVRDNGIGFDMADAEKIFAPFQRLDAARAFDGSGVGLATVRRIIEAHQGTIWAHSTPEEGATFYFTIGEGGASSTVSTGTDF